MNYLTRPATPRAILVTSGRYSFMSATDDCETIDLPARLREDKITSREHKVTVPDMPAMRRR
jgi:hypothetical protein